MIRTQAASPNTTAGANHQPDARRRVLLVIALQRASPASPLRLRVTSGVSRPLICESCCVSLVIRFSVLWLVRVYRHEQRCAFTLTITSSDQTKFRDIERGCNASYVTEAKGLPRDKQSYAGNWVTKFEYPSWSRCGSVSKVVEILQRRSPSGLICA